MKTDGPMCLSKRMVTYRGRCPTEAAVRVSSFNAHGRIYIFLRKIKENGCSCLIFSLVICRSILVFATTYLLTKNRSSLNSYGCWCPWFCVINHLLHLSNA